MAGMVIGSYAGTIIAGTLCLRLWPKVDEVAVFAVIAAAMIVGAVLGTIIAMAFDA